MLRNRIVREMGRAGFDPLRATIAAAIMLSAAPTQAQEQLPTGDEQPVPHATPLDWKWFNLREPAMSFEYVRRPGAPLIITFEEGIGHGSDAFGANFARYLYDEGYGLGVIWWRRDRVRFQTPSQTLRQALSALREVETKGIGFDLSRTIVVGWGAGAYMPALIAWDQERRAGAGLVGVSVCASIFFNGMDFDPTHPESDWAKRIIANEPDPTAASALHHVATAPPTLLMTRVRDRMAAQRAASVADAIRNARGTAVVGEYPRFEDNRAWTYLGYSENPATEVIGRFLKSHCPVGKRQQRG